MKDIPIQCSKSRTSPEESIWNMTRREQYNKITLQLSIISALLGVIIGILITILSRI